MKKTLLDYDDPMTHAPTNEIVGLILGPGHRACAFCEYFDGGGASRVASAVETGRPLAGDCLNRHSPCFQTSSHDTCPVFRAASDPGGAEPCRS